VSTLPFLRLLINIYRLGICVLSRNPQRDLDASNVWTNYFWGVSISAHIFYAKYILDVSRWNGYIVKYIKVCVKNHWYLVPKIKYCQNSQFHYFPSFSFIIFLFGNAFGIPLASLLNQVLPICPFFHNQGWKQALSTIL
jgi:hypothetical protein